MALGTTTFKEFLKWELADVIVTETTNLGKLAGFSHDQTVNLGYFVLKAAYLNNTGQIESIIDVVDAVKDMVMTKSEAINKLKDIGIDLNAPENKEAAATKTIDKVYNTKE